MCLGGPLALSWYRRWVAVGIADFGCRSSKAPTPQLTRGGAMVVIPLSAEGRRRCVWGGWRSESTRGWAGSVHYALGAAAAAMVVVGVVRVPCNGI